MSYSLLVTAQLLLNIFEFRQKKFVVNNTSPWARHDCRNPTMQQMSSIERIFRLHGDKSFALLFPHQTRLQLG